MQQAILDKIATIPGVSSVGADHGRPDDRRRLAQSDLRAGQGVAESQLPPIRLFKFVSPGF